MCINNQKRKSFAINYFFRRAVEDALKSPILLFYQTIEVNENSFMILQIFVPSNYESLHLCMTQFKQDVEYCNLIHIVTLYP